MSRQAFRVKVIEKVIAQLQAESVELGGQFNHGSSIPLYVKANIRASVTSRQELEAEAIDESFIDFFDLRVYGWHEV